MVPMVWVLYVLWVSRVFFVGVFVFQKFSDLAVVVRCACVSGAKCPTRRDSSLKRLFVKEVTMMMLAS